MIKHNIKDFYKGWFIGNFDPSLHKTEDFEVGLLTREKGLDETPHYHAIGTEYNMLVSGSMTLNETELFPGDIFIIEPNEVVYPVFHEDCQILCVKTPSIPGDKYEVL
jgi:quercetin dioxygenase-like cupin family protein